MGQHGEPSRAIRRIILEQSKRAGVGHIGSALSVADIVAALYFGSLDISDPSDPERDRFILSKGHAALAVYAALSLRGWISEAELDTYCGDDSLLGVHPEHSLRGVDFSTGSLGQGLSVGCGAALAARLKRSARRIFVLISDAECNEGSVWEAAMFGAHHRLSQLVAVLDLNGQQAMGHTRDVLSLAPMAERWRSFGWDVHEVDGHDIREMQKVIAGLDVTSSAPHLVIAATTIGKGVSYMQDQIKWHYWPMSADDYARAIREIGEAE